MLATVGLTLLGAIIPGTGLIAAGRRRLGLTMLGLFAVLCGVGGYILIADRTLLLHWSVEPSTLRLIGWSMPTIGGLWCLSVVVTYRCLRPPSLRVWQRATGGLVVSVLVLAVLAPFVMTARYALIQRDVIDHIFVGQEVAAKKPAGQPPAHHQTSPAKSSMAPDPWSGRARVNVLLLGGDAGPDRTGTRTDTMIVASIDTHTGDTVLFSVPRNLQKAPFPPGSALAAAYPNGFHAPGDDEEQLLTEVYENVPPAHGDLLKGAADPGATATSEAVSGVLGIPIDYYVLVDLKGFEKLIDMLGGLTVNVNSRIPIGGEPEAHLRPWGYIEAGPNQHMDGWTALWYARSRYGASDWDRMLRQRCVIKAIVDQANPITLLTRYEGIATTTKGIVSSDIPAARLPAFVDLALKVKNANLTSIAFLPNVIDPPNPDFAAMHQMVQNAIKASQNAGPAPKHLDNLATACAATTGSNEAPVSPARVIRTAP